MRFTVGRALGISGTDQDLWLIKIGSLQIHLYKTLLALIFIAYFQGQLSAATMLRSRSHQVRPKSYGNNDYGYIER